MKLLVLMTVFTVFQFSTATIDIAELTKSAKEKLNNAKKNLEELHKTASSQLTKLVMGINLENAKKVDILHVIPKVTKLKSLLKGESTKEALILDPYQAERLSYYFDHSKHRIIIHHH